MNIEFDKLEAFCNSPISGFEGFGTLNHTPAGMYIYRDNPRAKILGVAHLDTVLNGNFKTKKTWDKDIHVYSPALDDRLGVYTLCQLLPKLGIEFDLLLTEGEEIGHSTAEYFESHKSYNWMFSFDRRGHDVVMYQYDTPELRNDLESCNLKPGRGSFSDISFLYHLGIRGINVGTGYHGEHSHKCYASINELTSQIIKFKRFYDTFKDKTYSCEKISTYISQFNDGFLYGTYDGLMCYLCNKNTGIHQVFNDIWVCDPCAGECDMCESCNDIVYNYELMNGACANCQ